MKVPMSTTLSQYRRVPGRSRWPLPDPLPHFQPLLSPMANSTPHFSYSHICTTHLGVQSGTPCYLSTHPYFPISSGPWNPVWMRMASLAAPWTPPEVHLCVSEWRIHSPTWRPKRHLQLNRPEIKLLIFPAKPALPHLPHFSNCNSRLLTARITNLGIILDSSPHI